MFVIPAQGRDDKQKKDRYEDDMISKKNIPNHLTFARVLAVPVALALIVWRPCEPGWLLVVFVFAALTDFFDGSLARKWNAVSALGTMLDPIADKLLVAVILVYLLKFPLMPVLPVALLIARELYIAGLREFLAARNIALPVSRGGKWKTAVQLLAIATLLATISFAPQLSTQHTNYLWNSGMTLLWLSTLLSLSSAFSYTRKAWPHLQ